MEIGWRSLRNIARGLRVQGNLGETISKATDHVSKIRGAKAGHVLRMKSQAEIA